MSKLNSYTAFFAGTVVGAVVSGIILKHVYDKILEERFDSYVTARDNYPRESLVGEDISDIDPDIQLPNTTSQEYKNANRSYRKKVEEGGYIDYSGMHEKPTEAPGKPVQIDGEEERETLDKPYVISPDEYGEYSEYNIISLICFEDGVITDRDFDILDHPEEHIGKDACKHFGDYEIDAVHIRNDAKQCDYEILKDERLYAEAISQEPPPIIL